MCVICITVFGDACPGACFTVHVKVGSLASRLLKNYDDTCYTVQLTLASVVETTSR